MKDKKTNILLVDDENDILDLLNMYFDEEGYQTITANSGEEALRCLIKSHAEIDIVVTDIRMPGKYDGVKLLAEIKNRFPAMPVIFITGYSDVTIERAYEQGACALLDKPLDLQKLEETISWAIKSHPRALRKYPRANIELEVKIYSEHIGSEISSQTVNIGQGGLFIYTHNLPPVNSIIDFEIRSRSMLETPIEGKGEVVWVRKDNLKDLPPGMGIKFKNLSSQDKNNIKNLVNEINLQMI